MSKMIALAIAGAYVIAAVIWEKSWNFALMVAIGTLPPLVLIWFPDVLGNMTGLHTWSPMYKPSPPILVAGMGWFFLVVLPVITYILVSNHR